MLNRVKRSHTLLSVVLAAGFTLSAKAADLVEMQAFVFPPVALTGHNSQVCGNNMSDTPSPVEGLIGILDASDTSKLLSKAIPFSLAARKGTCVTLPNVQRSTPTEGGNVIVVIVFPSSATWNAVVGKAFICSLQLKEGGVSKVLTASFLPVIQFPTTVSQ